MQWTLGREILEKIKQEQGKGRPYPQPETWQPASARDTGRENNDQKQEQGRPFFSLHPVLNSNSHTDIYRPNALYTYVSVRISKEYCAS